MDIAPVALVIGLGAITLHRTITAIQLARGNQRSRIQLDGVMKDIEGLYAEVKNGANRGLLDSSNRSSSGTGSDLVRGVATQMGADDHVRPRLRHIR